MTDMSVEPAAVFRRINDDTYLPSVLAVGPWDPDALHGGPPCALLAGALERAVADAGLGIDFFPARFTAELSRPVPLAELTVTTTVRRPGRKICIADATIAGPDGTVASSATLLCIRRRPFEVGDQDDVATPPGPETGVPLGSATMDGPPAFHRSAVEHRCVSGTSFETPGPATDWIRLTVPLVEGRPTSPLERVVAAADFGNGVSQRFAMADVLFVNPDLTVVLHRLPEGEWVCLDAITRIGSEGVGVAESLLFDEHGPIGRSAQTLLVEAR